ncbi:MAG TPA: radical SAM protein [Candidatus Omnitrophica bacterium]|nr:radical SAM protein [Candidatus Omnitrophota bacterium]
MKYIYGPVKSRRIGYSLGLSLVPYKLCNYDCIYCQLGHTTKKTTQRKEYIKIKDILTELKSFVRTPDFKNMHIDYITLSGTGEPLLNSKISLLIKQIKEITPIPIALITNAYFLSRKDIRGEILDVDLIIPSLDAIDKDTYVAIDKPEGDGLATDSQSYKPEGDGLATDSQSYKPEGSGSVESIIDGLVNLRREFKGKIYLEVMVIKGINDKIDNFKKLNDLLVKIKPDKIHLNTPKRCASQVGVLAPDKNTLRKIKNILGANCEVV